MRHITEIPNDSLTLSKTRPAFCIPPWLLYFSSRTPSLITDLVSTIVHRSSQRVTRVLGILGQFVDRLYLKQTTPSPYKKNRFLVFRVRMKACITDVYHWVPSTLHVSVVYYLLYEDCRWVGWFNYLLKIGKSLSI